MCAVTDCISAVAAFARRLSRLRALSITTNGSPLEPWLAGPLALGPPLPGVRSLELHHLGDPATPETSPLHTLLTAFPGLRLVSLTLPLLPHNLGADLVRCCPALEALSLRQLRHCYSGLSGTPDAMERALQPLSQLQSLTALTADVKGTSIPSLTRLQLQAAAGITSLRSLCWHAEWDWESASALTTLASLTSLELHREPRTESPTLEMLSASVGNLPLLECLHLPAVAVDRALWHGALARLLRLRVLQAGGLSLEPVDGVHDADAAAALEAGAFGQATHAPPATLPTLQHLHLVSEQRGRGNTRLLSDLLAAVRAMPALAEVRMDLRLDPMNGGHFGRMMRGLLALDAELLRLPAEAVRIDLKLDLHHVHIAPIEEINRVFVIFAAEVDLCNALATDISQARLDSAAAWPGGHCMLRRIAQGRLKVAGLPHDGLGAGLLLAALLGIVAKPARVVQLSDMHLGQELDLGLGVSETTPHMGLAQHQRRRVVLRRCSGLDAGLVVRLAGALQRGAELGARMEAQLQQAIAVAAGVEALHGACRRLMGFVAGAGFIDSSGGVGAGAGSGVRAGGAGGGATVVLEVERCEEVCSAEGVQEVMRLWHAQRAPLVELKVVVDPGE